MRCVRLTLGLVVSPRQSHLGGFNPSVPDPFVEASDSGDDDSDDAFGSAHDNEMIFSSMIHPLSLVTKRRNSFGYERIVLLLGGELD